MKKKKPTKKGFMAESDSAQAGRANPREISRRPVNPLTQMMGTQGALASMYGGDRSAMAKAARDLRAEAFQQERKRRREAIGRKITGATATRRVGPGDQSTPGRGRRR